MAPVTQDEQAVHYICYVCVILDNLQPMNKILHQHWPLLLLTTILVFTTIGADSLGNVLQLQSADFSVTQSYRLITAHIIHLNAVHALMNWAATVLLWLIAHKTFSPRLWAGSMLAHAVLISLALLSQPHITWYVGFSGITYALIAQTSLCNHLYPSAMRILVIIALLSKVLYDMGSGQHNPTVEMIGGQVISEAHFFGLLSGIILGALLCRRHKA